MSPLIKHMWNMFLNERNTDSCYIYEYRFLTAIIAGQILTPSLSVTCNTLSLSKKSLQLQSPQPLSSQTNTQPCSQTGRTVDSLWNAYVTW